MKSPTYDRWGTYVHESGPAFIDLLQELSGKRDKTKKVCLILGRGFDPRMLSGLYALRQVFDPAELAVTILLFDEGDTSPSRRYEALVQDNLSKLSAVIPASQIEERQIHMFSAEGRRITSRSAAAAFRSPSELQQFSDIFVDVSALPRSVYFPVVAKLLFLLDGITGVPSPNLFVLVSESTPLDRRIVEEGIDEDAGYIHPFRGGMDRESATGVPKIWFLLLGESQHLQLSRIYDLINPDEVCLVLPSPAVNPRRADNLVIEYREMLFERLRVETRNFIYASETNPFEVYRQLRRSILHYGEALKPLGGSNAVISANSSKLLSVGALLAAYELKRADVDIAIAHVESHGYTLNGKEGVSAAQDE
ncbi:MAG: hypothetical protein WBA09_17225, partial [Candidatus Acidiferrum sp.]